MAAFDGFDQQGRRHLWKRRVVGQDKANLARIFQATNPPNNPSIKEGEHHQMQFAQAIAASDSSQQRLDFVSALHSSAAAGARDPSTNRSARHRRGDGRVDRPDTDNGLRQNPGP